MIKTCSMTLKLLSRTAAKVTMSHIYPYSGLKDAARNICHPIKALKSHKGYYSVLQYYAVSV